MLFTAPFFKCLNHGYLFQRICVSRSPSRYPLCSFRGNLVQHSWFPCPRRSCRQLLLTEWHFGDCTACRLQSTTIRCVCVQTIQPSYLNRRIRNRLLETAYAIPLCQTFQCIKKPPAMTSSAIITFTATYLSYAQLVHSQIRHNHGNGSHRLCW